MDITNKRNCNENVFVAVAFYFLYDKIRNRANKKYSRANFIR